MIRTVSRRASRPLVAAAAAIMALAAAAVLAQPAGPAAAPPTSQPAAAPASQPTTQPSAKPAPAADDPGTKLALAVEKAHGFESWDIQAAAQCQLMVSFTSGQKINGRLTFDIHSPRARLSLDSGTVMVFDGERAWFSPPTGYRSGARFSLRTWPYFISVPFKLRDPGARLRPEGTAELNSKTYTVTRLTFDKGVGDTPDDWYVLYTDPETHRLEAMAYIVTYGQSVSDAEQVPHAITFEDFVDVNGVSLATTWRFWNWSKDGGIVGAPVGEGKLANFRFGVAGDELFQRPGDSAEDRMPELPDRQSP